MIYRRRMEERGFASLKKLDGVFGLLVNRFKKYYIESVYVVNIYK